MAVAAHPGVDYVKVEHKLPGGETERLFLAEVLLPVIFGEEQPVVLEHFTGRNLKGRCYQPLFTFLPLDKPAHFVVNGEFVTTADSTGLVHIAPAFGAEDIPVYKVSILGDGAVGKTSLVRRYCEGRFEHSRVMTIGVDFQIKVVQVGERSIKLSIWDVAGQPRFKAMREGFYRGSLAAALVYDLPLDESLMNLDGWYLELKKNA